MFSLSKTRSEQSLETVSENSILSYDHGDNFYDIKTPLNNCLSTINQHHQRTSIFYNNIFSKQNSSTKINSINSYSSNILKHLNALKNLQIIYNQLEGKYLNDVNNLEYEYFQQYTKYFSLRSSIINGQYEPTDDECRLMTDRTNNNEISSNNIFMDDEQQQQDNMIAQENEEDKDIRGIPYFWLTTLKQVQLIGETIEDYDEPILKFLQDIKLKLHIGEITGFTLEFYFDNMNNSYFSNQILTKFYELQIKPDINNQDDLLYYEGTAIIKTIGCSINWYKTKNVTFNDKNEKRSSFFWFFSPPTQNDNDYINDDDYALKLATDFEIGHFIRENIIGKAVLYYTGEALDDQYLDDLETSDEDNGNEGDDQQSDKSSEQQSRGEENIVKEEFKK